MIYVPEFYLTAPATITEEELIRKIKNEVDIRNPGFDGSIEYVVIDVGIIKVTCGECSE